MKKFAKSPFGLFSFYFVIYCLVAGSGPNVREVYQHFGARIVSKFDIASDHAQVCAFALL